jgi:type I restriction enzyme R subunit
MSTTEKRARENIDAMFTQCRWVLRDYKKLVLSAAQGIAVRELPLKHGCYEFASRPSASL